MATEKMKSIVSAIELDTLRTLGKHVVQETRRTNITNDMSSKKRNLIQLKIRLSVCKDSEVFMNYTAFWALNHTLENYKNN